MQCLQRLRVSRARYNVLAVSIAFMVLFAAYNTLQGYATSLLPGNLGNLSLATLYGSVAITVFFAPAMVDSLGSRLTMIIGGVTYVAYMISLVDIRKEIVLPMSVVIGFGAAILWVALGVFIAQNSTRENYGQNTGIFWSIFQICNIVGNLCTYLVFSKLTSDTMLFIGFAIFGAVGVAGLFLLRPRQTGIATKTQDHGTFAGLSVTASPHASSGRPSCAKRMQLLLHSIAGALRLLFTVDTALLLPMYFFSGLELSFWSGEFPQLLDVDVIGLVLTFAGVGEVVGGYMFGRLSDRLGRTLSTVLGAIIYAVGLGLATWMKEVGPNAPAPMVAGAPLAAYFAAACFGLGDSAFNTNTYAIVAQLYDEKRSVASSNTGSEALQPGERERLLGGEHGALAVSSAEFPSSDNTAAHADAVEAKTHSVGGFTIFQLIQNIGSAVGFYYALPDPMHGSGGKLTQVYVQAALLVAAVAGYATVMRRQSAAAR